MKIVSTVKELTAIREELKGSVGFVATMGAMHNGHLSLIRQARIQNDTVVVSIFVNPTQFLPNEDYEKYPRREEADLKICTLAGVDILFMPTCEEMYAKTEPEILAPKNLAYILEGSSRPGHFDGVLRIVLKLLNLVRPTNAYFGKKDAQQLYLIQNMVKTLFINTNIIPCDIVRESDGLALSSRNIYLGEKDRVQALALSIALKNASQAIMKGEREAKKIELIMLESLQDLKVDYAKALSRNFEAKEQIIVKETILLIAAFVGNTRLIDNLWI
ncbi:MAG: pantoate--beta-alanine ligase [Campylobacteraceae bacterium]|jgi:pantoate--beta-alanine ligase|nr:pantoate--beta-alanine ligase [Campylobacteraceae bacterium]